MVGNFTPYSHPTGVPYSQEAEEAVLGAILLDPEAFAVVAAFLGGSDFYIVRHQYIWEAMAAIAERREPIDNITLAEQLRTMGRLGDIGGPAYITQLINSAPTSYNAEVYGKLVQRAATRRRLLLAADEIKTLALNEEVALEQIRADAEKQFTDVWEEREPSYDSNFRELVAALMDDVDAKMENPEKAMGVPTGFRDLDTLTCGLHASDLTIIGGRPSAGKTSFMLALAMNAAQAGKRVGVATLEMDKSQIIQRCVALESGINLHKIRTGKLSAEDHAKFVNTCGAIYRLPIFINDTPHMSVTHLRATAMRWLRNHQIDVLFVDYLQILSTDGRYREGDRRTDEVSYFARELKQLARELHVPVIAGAQLSRSLESRPNKRPVLSDLRDSGEIEQEADIVHFIYRDVMYNETTEFPNTAEIITAKHRNGPTGTTMLHFDRTSTRFSDRRTQTIDLSTLELKPVLF